MGIRYKWQDASPIKQLDVAKNPSARLEAIIYPPDIINEKTADLPQYLAKHGFICYLDEIKGENVLKVSSFGKRADALIETLRSGGYTFGDAATSKIADKTPKLSAWARIRRNSLNLTGIFGDVGHLTMAVSGKLEGDNNRIATAASYGTGATIQALFGTGVGAIRFSEMISDMRDYLSKKGIELSDPLITTPEIRYRDRTSLERALDFLKRHPIQISQAITFVGNISLFQSGLREIRRSGTGFGRLFAGLASGTSALIAMFMPQATPEEIEEDKKQYGFFKTLREGRIGDAIKNIPHNFFMLIRRSPLGFQGALLLSDNMGMLFDAYQVNRKYKVWKEGGDAPPGIRDAIKSAITRTPPVTQHQDSHYQRINAIDEQLHKLEKGNQHTLYDATNPKEALKAQQDVAELVKQREELQKQITGLERVPYGAVFSWITAVTYTTASLFNTITSKNRDKSLETHEVYNELYTYAANTILDVPEKARDQIIKRMALYLSGKPDVKVSEQEVETGIKSKLSILKQSPWLTNVVKIDEAVKYGDGMAARVDTKRDSRPWMEKVTDTAVMDTSHIRT